MPEQVDKKYLKDLTKALNGAVDQEVWGQFGPWKEDTYTWCNHLEPSAKPEMRIRVYIDAKWWSVEGGRVHATTASHPSIFKFNKHFQPYSGSSPNFDCTFSSTRPVSTCAREIVRKVLSPWIEPWDKVMETVRQDIKRYERFLEVRRKLCGLMNARVPDDADEKGKLFNAADHAAKCGAISADIRYHGTIDLTLQSVSIEVAEALIKVLDQPVTQED